MYETLISKYEIMFEGIPEPIFYGRYYPMGHKEGPHGEELWDLFSYGRGLKNDKDPSARLFKRFEGEYETDLRTLLNCVMRDTKGSRRGVVVIPSSKRGNTNRVTELVRRTLASNPGPFADLTGNFFRSRHKDSAHEGGDRSIASNARTLEVRPRGALSQFGTILVIDDIVTSGNSFRAADEVLRSAGFKGTIVNFAFARTFPSDGAALCLEAKRNDAHIIYATGGNLDEHWGSHPIDGFIFDLDQTLLEDPIRDSAYEGVLRRDWGRQSAVRPYSTYEGVSDIFGLHLPIAVLSNRPLVEIEHIIEDSKIYDSEYIASAGRIGWPVKPFSFPTEENDGYTIRYYKPSSKGVKEAIGYLDSICAPIAYANAPRVIGVGNTKEDIFAYGEAGIGSALALWGVPDYLKDYAASHWGAAYVFSTPRDLVEWCGKMGGFYEKAVFFDTEPRNEKRAIDYYGIAIDCGDHVMEAALRLAHLLAEEDPEKAIGLYELAIESGDERYATNNLARLIAGESPEKAKELYERAIAAGDELYATNNLANLIAGESPEKAKELYERAIAAGDEYHATNGLARLIAPAEPAKAIMLYERAIAAGDERFAPRNLAVAIIGDDPNRSVDLLELAAKNGNWGNLAVDLQPAVKGGNLKAVDLYERIIVESDEKKANDLANLIKTRMPERAEVLYRRAIAAGDERYATFNLAAMLASSNPEEAEALYARAIKAGDTEWAPNNLGTLIASKDPNRARALFQQSIDAGDEVFATCNLAHTYLPSDANRAIHLYERSLRSGDETEAKIGLSYLLKDEQPGRARDLAAQALAASNLKPSFDFLVELVTAYGKGAAFEIAQYLIDLGYRDATETLIKLEFGENYDPENGVLFFGADVGSGAQIPWLVLGPAYGGYLLLSKCAICKKPFVDDAPEAVWEASEVRRWLNGPFEERCFNSEEIDSTIVRSDLGDRFFCLSGSELDEHLSSEHGKTSKMAFDCKSQTATKWWLRPTDGGTLSAPCVDEAGKQTWNFALVDLGVRPAVILRLR